MCEPDVLPRLYRRRRPNRDAPPECPEPLDSAGALFNFGVEVTARCSPDHDDALDEPQHRFQSVSKPCFSRRRSRA